jgi:hypothetical protein
MARLLGIFLASLFLASPAFAFHCGTKLIHEGDSIGSVRAKCGDPAEITVRYILRRPVAWVHGTPVLAGTGVTEVPVETWIYNFGPNKLMRRLRFEDGELVDIETLGYGYLK